MADANAFGKVADAIRIEEDIEIIVVSAGGKTSNYPKITDMLADAYKKIQSGEGVKRSLDPFFERIRQVKSDLKLNFNFEDELMKIEVGANDPDFLISRGEYLYSLMFAEYLRIPFVDAKDVFKFFKDSNINEEDTCFKIKERYKSIGRFVTGGFYGSDDCGKIKTFPRGGGDVSGAIAAKAINADLFVDFTDVDGVYAYDPRIVGQNLPIPEISYSDLENLAEFGAKVIHPTAVKILARAETKAVIKNTFNPRRQGTLICAKPSKKYFAAALKDGCVYIKIKTKGKINIDDFLPEAGRIGVVAEKNGFSVLRYGKFDEFVALKQIGSCVEIDESVTAIYVTESNLTSRFLALIKESVKVYASFAAKGGYIIAIPAGEKEKTEEIICRTAAIAANSGRE